MEEQMEVFIRDLIQWIHRHDGCRVDWADFDKQLLSVSSFVVDKDGRVDRHKETIKATVKEVQKWLGY